MKKKSDKLDNVLSDEDRALFREAVAGVRPLTSSRQWIAHSSKPVLRVRAPVAELDWDVYPQQTLPPVGGEDVLSFRRPGIQNRVFSQLKRGKFHPEAVLDLHGLYAAQAQKETRQFLSDCLKRAYGCVSIIHGKNTGRGTKYPVLKNQLNQTLQACNHVLAFHSAPVNRGGVGAVYVLLSKGSLKDREEHF
ncbi:MAG: Smr/MutS family protein [Gammaproteobacteria bacterium]|nr:Smr/MutS family protein [Gammaproteobacteria bacterium]